MNTCCCCFSLRAGTILIALISIISSFPFVNDILQYWNNDRFSPPLPVRKGVLIHCSSSESIHFEFFVPLVLSNELAHILIVLFFIFSLFLLHGAFMRKKITCLPWLWLTSLCFALDVCTTAVGLIQTMLFRSCQFSTSVYPVLVVLIIYLCEAHLIIVIDNYCEQLGREIIIQPDQQNFIGPPVQLPNHTIVPPVTPQTVPEVVIYPNPHLDLPPAYDEIIRPSAPPPD